MGLLNWLEALPLSVWVHESPSIWAQPTIMTLHTMGMGVLVGSSWLLDLRLLGLGKNVPLATTNGAESLTAVVNGKLVEIRVPYPRGLLHQAPRRQHRRPERRLEGTRPVDDVGHAHRVPQRGRHAEPAQGLQGPGSPGSAGAVSCR